MWTLCASSVSDPVRFQRQCWKELPVCVEDLMQQQSKFAFLSNGEYPKVKPSAGAYIYD